MVTTTTGQALKFMTYFCIFIYNIKFLKGYGYKDIEECL